MNQTEKIVIEIVKEIFSGEPAVIPENPDRNAVCKELINQSVYTLAYGWLKDHNYISSDSIQHGMQQMLRQTSKWYFMMDQQQVLVDLLTKEGYVFAVMKGSANAAGYPTPELRKSGDIDILIKEEEYDEIRRFLLQNGYALKEGLDHGKHHFEMTKKGVTIEVHKRPGGINREKTDKNSELVAFFQQGLDSVEWKELYDYTFPVLPDLQNGIMLLLHTAQHLSTTGIGLRHLIDWMLFAERYLSDECWTQEFEQAAKKAEVDTLAGVLTRTCQIYLGLCSEISWCRDIDRELCDATMDYFIQQGEFGNKSRDRASRIIAENRTLTDYLRYFDRSSTYSMPAAAKIPLMRPLAWSYQLFRYIRYLTKMALEKDSVSTMQKSIASGMQKRELLDRLKISS